MKTEIKLKVISDTQSRTRIPLIIDPPETIFFMADGDTNFYCGRCGCLLADSIKVGQLSKIILKCNKCQSLNEMQ